LPLARGALRRGAVFLPAPGRPSSCRRTVLLDVGEAGHCLSFDEVRAVGQPNVDQAGDAVAQRSSWLLGLVERYERLL
jgi:hypothetical protein